jgi:membrane protease YdiL (CAAX protease family)
MTDGGKRMAALHCGVFFAFFAATMLAMPTIGWPWYFFAPLSAYAFMLIVPALRRSMPRLAIGRVDGAPLGFAFLIAIGASAVLIGFDVLLRPDVQPLAAKVPLKLGGSVVLAGIVFAVTNAVCEELVFRWLLWQAIVEEWNLATALVVSAGFFGLAHLQGYPPGPLGAVLAGVYGLSLGILRWWTAGLGLAFACHVVADATIFVILARNSVGA